MANRDDIRRIALRLPGVSEDPNGFTFSVPVKGKQKGFVWAWMERIEPKKPKVAHPEFVAVLVPGLAAKDLLLSSRTDAYFTEPHYNGFPAVLLRPQSLSIEELEDLLLEAWRCKAGPELQSRLNDS